MPLHYPGHSYLGPGSNIYSGKVPIDEDDFIAFVHDLAYSNASSKQDIRSADRKAISEFARNFYHTGNFHSALGAVGLSSKYLVESLTGVLYGMPTPKNWAAIRKINAANAKRKAVNQPGPSAKQPAVEEPEDQIEEPFSPGTVEQIHNALKDNPEYQAMAPQTVQPMDVQDGPEATAAGGSGGGGGRAQGGVSAGQQLYIHRFRKPNNVVTLNYRKNFKWRIWGYAWQTKTVTVDNKQIATKLGTSLAGFPMDWLPMYINNAEWSLIKGSLNAKVKHCSMTLTPCGYNASFDTNSSLSGSASSQDFIEGLYSNTLYEDYPCGLLKYTPNATNPMVPGFSSAVKTDLDPTDVTNVMYNNDLSQATVQGNSWPWYIESINFAKNDKNTGSYLNANQGDFKQYNISQSLSRYNFADACVLKHSFHEEWTPQNGLIFTGYTDLGLGTNGIVYSNPNAWKEVDLSAQVNTSEVPVIGQVARQRYGLTQGNNMRIDCFSFEQRIEKSPLFFNQSHPTKNTSPKVLCLGLNTVKSSVPGDEANFVQSHGDFYMDTSIVIECDFNSGPGTCAAINWEKETIYGVDSNLRAYHQNAYTLFNTSHGMLVNAIGTPYVPPTAESDDENFQPNRGIRSENRPKKKPLSNSSVIIKQGGNIQHN